jgi:iron-sulfur cluster assembly protein
MALDEPRETDEAFEIDKFKFVVDKNFLEKAQPIKVDYLVSGFKLDCGIDFGASACSGCGSDSASSSCSG